MPRTSVQLLLVPLAGDGDHELPPEQLLPTRLTAVDNDIPGLVFTELLAASPGHGSVIFDTTIDDIPSKLSNIVGGDTCAGEILFIGARVFSIRTCEDNLNIDIRICRGCTYIVAPPNRRVAALEVVAALSLSTGSRAGTEVEVVGAELIQDLLTEIGHGVWGEGEDIAVGLGVVLSCLLRRRSVEVVDVGPNVTGEVDVDVLDDFVGGTRNFDLLSIGDTWDIQLPGRLDNRVQGHLAVSIGSKDGVVVIEHGSAVGDDLI